MPRYNQRQPDYVNMVAGFLVWRAIFKVATTVIGCVLVGLYVIAYSIWPDQAPTVAATIVIILIAGGVLAFLYMIVNGVYRLFIPRRRETMNESFVRIGLVPNPPEPWFDDAGKPIWERTNDGWQKIPKERG